MNKEKIVNITLWFLLLLSFFYIALVFASPEITVVTIKAPVVNMFSQPDSKADVVSQAIYGSTAKVIQSGNEWSLINTPDGYHGWINNNDFAEQPSYPKEKTVKIKVLSANINQEPTINSNSLLELPFDARLQLLGTSPDKKWYKVGLVGGGEGWVQQNDAIINPKNLTMKEMLTLSRQFLEIPYFWGGTSSFGYDCSGFVQMLFKQMGILIPRDTRLQVNWDGFTVVSKNNLQPGDVIFFAWNGDKISHVGLYLGNNLFINATAYEKPEVKISDLTDDHWQEGFVAARRLNPNRQSLPEFKGSIDPVSKDLQAKMQKYTWRQGCPVAIDALAELKLSYWGFDSKVHQGILIVNKELAPEVLDIFKEIYEQRFPIDKMTPIEEYKGDDNSSMLADNTSAFNCRAMTDFPDQYSVHSYGSAIDINPLINPYINGDKVEPASSAKYADRNVYAEGKITADSIVYQAFVARGWQWGGDWTGAIKDYQHFEKPENQ